MTVKRGRDEEGEGEGGGGTEALAMANCLMLLSRVGEKGLSDGRLFACKTCHRQFPSFQALGGHRTSHGKPKLEEDIINKKNKMHGCSICGKTFLTGQSLGGHMRRHREVATGRSEELTAWESKGSRSRVEDDEKRILRMRLAVDLNLTPLQNYLRMGNASFKFVLGLV